MALFCVVFAIWGAKYVRRSGMLDPYAEREYLTDEEAAQRVVYQTLDDDEKALYTALYRGISRFDERIRLPFDASGEMYRKVYYLIEKNEGEMFYIDSAFYTAEKIKNAKIVYRLNDEDEFKEKTAALEEKIQEIAADIPADWGDYKKLVFIHDYIIKNCSYTPEGRFDSTAYGCLVEGKARCEGYSKAFSLLANEVGIKAVVLTGETDDGEKHAWNQAEIDGEWYNIDVTWDDNDKDGELSHNYFLRDNVSFYKKKGTESDSHYHIADDDCFEPIKCVSKNNYYIREGLYVNETDQAKSIIKRELADGADSVELAFANLKIYSAFKDRYINNEEIFDILVESGYSGLINLSLTENESELTMRIKFAN